MPSGSCDDNSDDMNGCYNDGKGKVTYFLISYGKSLSGKGEQTLGLGRRHASINPCQIGSPPDITVDPTSTPTQSGGGGR